MSHSHKKGFTLIELMVVVAIIGIIAAIAYPAYTNSVLNGRRAEGQAALIELIQQQERYMTQRNTYLAFTTNSAGVTTPADVPFKTFSGNNWQDRAYTLSAEACPATGGGTLALNECIRAVATPRVADAAANVLRLTSTNTKDCTGTTPAVCWR